MRTLELLFFSPHRETETLIYTAELQNVPLTYNKTGLEYSSTIFSHATPLHEEQTKSQDDSHWRNCENFNFLVNYSFSL